MAVTISKCGQCRELIHLIGGEWIHKFGADLGHPPSPFKSSAGEPPPRLAGDGPPDREHPRPRKGGPS